MVCIMHKDSIRDISDFKRSWPGPMYVDVDGAFYKALENGEVRLPYRTARENPKSEHLQTKVLRHISSNVQWSNMQVVTACSFLSAVFGTYLDMHVCPELCHVSVFVCSAGGSALSLICGAASTPRATYGLTACHITRYRRRIRTLRAATLTTIAKTTLQG
eukprot:6584366-Pyramimonas_sp.AAC.1